MPDQTDNVDRLPDRTDPGGRGRETTTRQEREELREETADELGVDASEVGVRETRGGGVDVRLGGDGRQQLRETVASEDEFVRPDEVEVSQREGIDARVTDDGRRAATARRFEDAVGVDVAADEVRMDDDGVRLESDAQRRVDSARIDDVRSELPESDDIFFPTGSTEARNVSAAIGRELETGDVGRLSDVSAAAGRSTGGIDSSIIEDLDPAFADELSRVEPEDIEQAQADIQARRELLDEDPSAFFEGIADDPDRFVEDATRLDRRAQAGRAARRGARQQAQEIEVDIASDSDLLSQDDIDVRPDLGAGEFDVEIDGQSPEEFERDQRTQQGVELFRELDDQTDQQLTTDDVDFQVDGDEISVEVTGDAVDRLEQPQQDPIADIRSTFDAVPQQTRRASPTRALDNIETVDTQTAQIGTETAQSGIDDPLRSTDRDGISIGGTQLVGAGEAFPDSVDDISEIDFGRDEVITTDLPTSISEAAPIVRDTSRSVASVPFERAAGSAVQRSQEARRLIDGDFEELVDSPTGQTAVAAGAAGIAAPEPATTVGGAAVAGGAILGAGALEASQRSEIETPETTDEVASGGVEVTELDAPTTREQATTGGVSIGELDGPTTAEQARTGGVSVGELGAPTTAEQARTGGVSISELDAPEDGSFARSGGVDINEIGVPTARAGELVQPEQREIIIVDEPGTFEDQSTFESEEEFQGRFVERRREEFGSPEITDDSGFQRRAPQRQEEAVEDTFAFPGSLFDPTVAQETLQESAVDQQTGFGQELAQPARRDPFALPGQETPQTPADGVSQAPGLETATGLGFGQATVELTEAAFGQPAATETVFEQEFVEPTEPAFVEPTLTEAAPGQQQPARPGARPPRPFWDEEEPSEAFEDLFAFDDETFDSGILGGDEAAEGFFSNGR